MPDKLPEGMSVDDLKRKHSSRPHNPIIAGVFFKGGLIEAWGRGTINILNECKDAGLPEPEFKIMSGGIAVTLFKDIYNKENLKKMGLNKRQIKIVLLLKEKSKVTNKEIREIVNVTDRTIVRDCNVLCDKGILEKTKKTGRGTEYMLTRHKPDKPDINPT